MTLLHLRAPLLWSFGVIWQDRCAQIQKIYF
jgi:hypothetical protein